MRNSEGGCGSMDISGGLLRGFLDDEVPFFAPTDDCHITAFIKRPVFRLIRKGKETNLEAVH